MGWDKVREMIFTKQMEMKLLPPAPSSPMAFRKSPLGQFERRAEEALRPPDGSFAGMMTQTERANRPHDRHPQRNRPIR